MTEPTPLQASLAGILGKRGLVLGADALLPDDDWDPALLRAEANAGAEAARALAWSRHIPDRFVGAKLDDLPPLTRTPCAAWATDPERGNLLLLGPVGVGKSHAAVAACRAVFFTRGYEVRFFPVTELLDLLRPGGPEHAMTDLCEIELLILDDLGAERSTEWASERLNAVINRRWLERRPTVATSNLEADALELAIGPRAFSRLVGGEARAVLMAGKDRRRAR